MRLLLRFLFALTLALSSFGCGGQSPDKAQAKSSLDGASRGEPLVSDLERMVGNWTVDLKRSALTGVRPEDSETSIKVVIAPSGERQTFQNHVLIETAQLTLDETTPNGESVFSFKPSRREKGTEVGIQWNSEEEMVWTFKGVSRTEVLVREVMNEQIDE